MIVFLCSYPRSGNSRFTMTVRNATNWQVDGLPVVLDYVGVFTREAVDESLASYNDPGRIYLIKRHGAPCHPDLNVPYRAIYIIRDGRDAVVSYAHMHADIDQSNTGHDYDWWLHCLVEGKFAPPYGNWADHVKLVSPECNTLIRYEDMNNNTIIEALEKVGVTCKLGEVKTFDELVNRWGSGFFRRGIVGSYKDEMPPELIEDFNERYGDKLKQYGYEL